MIAAISTSHDEPLTIDALCAWQRTMMTGSPLPSRFVGVIRDEQGWIGGTSPLDAALVTPPPERLAGLLDDLVAFMNGTDLDPIAQTAIAHAQFEVIHPFADGNGRVGRVLISWMLSRRLALVTPPPVSIRLAADRGGYLSGLTTFRLGRHEPWIRWFADAVVGAAESQRALITEVGRLAAQWRRRLTSPTGGGRTVRGDALSWRVLDLLPGHPVLTSRVVASELGASDRAASGALGALVQAGILAEHQPTAPRTPGRPARLFVSPDLLGLVGNG